MKVEYVVAVREVKEKFVRVTLDLADEDQGHYREFQQLARANALKDTETPWQEPYTTTSVSHWRTRRES